MIYNVSSRTAKLNCVDVSEWWLKIAEQLLVDVGAATATSPCAGADGNTSQADSETEHVTESATDSQRQTTSDVMRTAELDSDWVWNSNVIKLYT